MSGGYSGDLTGAQWQVIAAAAVGPGRLGQMQAAACICKARINKTAGSCLGLCGPGHGAGSDRIRPGVREDAMTSPDKSRHIEVTEGGQTVAAAEVTTLDDAGRTVRASLLPSSGPAPPYSRASLVDAVMDLPEVQASSRLEATVPLGDAGSLQRLRERTEDTVTRPAGSTALVDADIPAGLSQEPGGQSSAS
jgi:hypothetical protein